MSFTHQQWDSTIISKNTVKKDKKSSNPGYINPSGISIIKNHEDPDDIKPKIIDSDFCQNMIKARLEKGLTQKQLAALVALPVSVINDYERGSGVHNGSYISKIKKILNIHK